MKNDQLNLKFSVIAVTCHIAVWGFGFDDHTHGGE
jgi:hypothetical protein